jgi:Na+-translocating ferredoxin:NAD+ oxidoreductase RnfC subunit
MATGEEIVQRIRDAGVVGAGGAGFPAHVKAGSHVDVVIANGAECEPLVHVDQELLIARAPDVLAGLQIVMQATGAQRGVMGIKQRYTRAIAAVQDALTQAGITNITISELGNFYPAGDEQVLVYDVLGRVVPEGGIPLNVGAVVQNIETLLNIHRAMQGTPVITKFVTVIGDVLYPITVEVPLGITLRQAIELAGGSRTPDPMILNGGAMMGRQVETLDEPVTKTTKMLLVLPQDHYLTMQRKQTKAAFERRAASACDQCVMCTDFCPRHALGHAIEPHKLVRLLGTNLPITDPQLAASFLCCECRTCNYACPVHLLPADVSIATKRRVIAEGGKNPYHRETQPDPYRDLRRVPIVRLISRLALDQYDVPAHLTSVAPVFSRVTLPLKQHTGAPARPVVAPGDVVTLGQLVAEIPAGALGARVHASIAGTVVAVTDSIIIEAN